LVIAKVWGPDDGVPVLAVHGLMDNGKDKNINNYTLL
jgi:hypothetical protein